MALLLVRKTNTSMKEDTVYPKTVFSSGVENIGKMIRQARQYQGMSRVELADVLGVHHNTLVNYEVRGRPPSLEFLQFMAETMGYELEISMSRKEDVYSVREINAMKRRKQDAKRVTRTIINLGD